jgi:tryprostatin B 6-hydroxylase
VKFVLYQEGCEADAVATGTNGCIGRALAIIEMRNLITYWIQNFDVVSFAPGEDGGRIMNETLDHFTLGVKPLHLVFSEKSVE